MESHKKPIAITITFEEEPETETFCFTQQEFGSYLEIVCGIYLSSEEIQKHFEAQHIELVFTSRQYRTFVKNSRKTRDEEAKAALLEKEAALLEKDAALKQALKEKDEEAKTSEAIMKQKDEKLQKFQNIKNLVDNSLSSIHAASQARSHGSTLSEDQLDTLFSNLTQNLSQLNSTANSSNISNILGNIEGDQSLQKKDKEGD